MLKIASLAELAVLLIVENFAPLRPEVLPQIAIPEQLLQPVRELALALVGALATLQKVFTQLDLDLVPDFALVAGFVLAGGIGVVAAGLLLVRVGLRIGAGREVVGLVVVVGVAHWKWKCILESLGCDLYIL